ncbi:MAG: SusD/RagB family nutrient-binding outer membrane lipoprotein [Cyclobacteriaceae bacterium]|nr:SusD/RagB family nutrient-binding outer membrane lipoprotein [Cyclobacteriaceae bacterium]
MNYSYKIILSILIVFAPGIACDTEDLHEMNINPEALNEVNMNFVFTAAELSVASGGFAGDNRYIDWRTNIGYCSYFVQHLASTSTSGLTGSDKYFENNEAWSAPWAFWYGDVGKNLALIFSETGPGGFEEGRRKNTVAASKILWALNFHRLTDFYGNIPYKEACQGTEGVFLPKYDTQQSVYTDLFSKLSEGVSEISTSNDDDGFAAADIIYDGDINKWKKWGNSLMLRLAMRISNVDPSTAATYVTQAVSGGVFSSNDDNAWVPMADGPGEWVNQNGISRAFQPGDGGHSRVMSKTLIDFLKGADPNNPSDVDPRLFILTEGIHGNTNPVDQEGMPNGLDEAGLDVYTGIPNSSPGALFTQVNMLLLDDSDPYQLMNYAEVCFLMAEAIERGIGTVPGTAQQHYENGVKAAMQMYTPLDASLDVSDAKVAVYLAKYPYGGGGVTGGESKLEQIGYQMWVSKFMNWWEAWCDWRRTGYPTLEAVNYPGSGSPGVIPTKLRVPISEAAINGINYDAGATKPDSPVGKVWWDQ